MGGTPNNQASGFEVLVGDEWSDVPIVGHDASNVHLGVSPKQMTAPKLRYLWYSNPCGYLSFNCAVYTKTKAFPSPRLSGELDFLPLAPFTMKLDLSNGSVAIAFV